MEKKYERYKQIKKTSSLGITKKSESCFGIILVKKESLRVHIISEDGREVTLE